MCREPLTSIPEKPSERGGAEGNGPGLSVRYQARRLKSLKQMSLKRLALYQQALSLW